MTLHANDGGTWRQASQVSVNDGGTWRTAQEVWVNDGGTWRKVFSASGPVSNFGGSMASFKVGSAASDCFVTFNTDGTITGGGDGVTLDEATGDTWFSPIGDASITSYWVRATLTSGDAPSSGSTGVWQQMTGSRLWGYISGTGGVSAQRSGTLLFEFSATSGGPVVASGTYNFDASREA